MLEIHELQDSGQIGVTFVYNEEVKESLKQNFDPREGRTWDPDSKMWKFPAELFEHVKAWALSHFDEAMIRLPGEVKSALSSLSYRNSHKLSQDYGRPFGAPASSRLTTAHLLVHT